MKEIFLSSPGPLNIHAVFEDDGETGYLYLYREQAPNEGRILGIIHVYDKAQCPNITESDISIGWKEDKTICYIQVGNAYRELRMPT